MRDAPPRAMPVVTRDVMPQAPPVVTRRSQPWLGTFVEITVRHRNIDLTHRAIAAGFAAIAHVHRAMSPQVAGSDVARINRAPVDVAVRVCEATWNVLRIADDLHGRSDGLFDCAVDSGGAPSSQRDLDLSREGEVIKRSPLAIDLGGIAKGYAVDDALRAVRHAGAAGACVNAGGDIAVFGDDTYRIEVRDPFEPGTRHPLVELDDFSVATSSIEERDALYCGMHARHVDRVAFDRGATICVLAPQCVHADALTKVVALSGAAAHPLLAPLLAYYGASAIVLDSHRA